MNSSTKPPHNTKKFQFDTDFDVEEERLRVDSIQQHQDEINDLRHAAAASVFSEEELAQAREEAFKGGYNSGLEEVKKSMEQTIQATVDKMLLEVSGLLEQEEQRLQDMREVALRTAIAAIKKIWPQVVQKLNLSTVENTLRQSMEYNPEETRLVMRVHDRMLDAIIKRLPQIQEQQAFAGKVIIIADEAVSEGDCKIEWADGGLERLSRSLSAQLDDAFDRILNSIPQSSQNADPERISQ